MTERIIPRAGDKIIVEFPDGEARTVTVGDVNVVFSEPPDDDAPGLTIEASIIQQPE